MAGKSGDGHMHEPAIGSECDWFYWSVYNPETNEEEWKYKTIFLKSLYDNFHVAASTGDIS